MSNCSYRWEQSDLVNHNEHHKMAKKQKTFPPGIKMHFVLQPMFAIGSLELQMEVV